VEKASATGYQERKTKIGLRQGVFLVRDEPCMWGGSMVVTVCSKRDDG
jgi:hypothetical protein